MGHANLNRLREDTLYFSLQGSIEQPHNKIHLIVGGAGHFGDNDTSAFDPIFHLHHCNVDRLWAFWQHIYPDYVAGTEGYLDIDGMTRHPFMQSGGSFSESSDQKIDDETPLAPFRKSNGAYWNSRDAQYLGGQASTLPQKYYTYQPIGPVHLNVSTPLSQAERSRQRAYLQRHFDPHYDDYADILELDPVMNTPRRFVLTTSLSQTAFRGSYMLKVFMGEAEIGSVAVLGRRESAKCGNCQAQRKGNVRVRGVVPIPHPAVVGAVRGLAEDSDVMDAIRSSFRASLVLPSGRVIARFALGSRGGLSEETDLPDEAKPSVRLFSCSVSQPTLEENVGETPHGFGNWFDHGPIDNRGWCKAI
ncbi:tyrosinase [Ceratobasidium sp. AG-Ba]|nr:tyrosinase [Ceratobasidium sp. AG-Ba]